MKKETYDLIRLVRRTKDKSIRSALSDSLSVLIKAERIEYAKRMNNINEEIEKWVDVVGYEGLYMVSDYGRIKSLKRKGRTNDLISIGHIHKWGYVKVCLLKDNISHVNFMHVIVADCFIPNPENFLQVNHKDSDKTNNKVSNLERCNNSHNQIHAHENSVIDHNVIKGEKSNFAKLRNKDVLEIRELIRIGTPNKDIASAYNISKSNISFIKNNKRWGHLIV